MTSIRGIEYKAVIYRIAGNFRGTKYSWFSNIEIYFVGNIFVVVACTAGKGRQGRFMHSWVKYSWSDFQPRNHEYFSRRKLYTVGNIVY